MSSRTSIWPSRSASIASRASQSQPGMPWLPTTAERVQSSLRGLLYDHVTNLGPAYFTRARTGDVIVSMVEGIQQLETYFGQYLPQLCVAVLTPILIFFFVAFIDVPVALVML